MMKGSFFLLLILGLFLSGCATSGKDRFPDIDSHESDYVPRDESLSVSGFEGDGSSLWRQGDQGLYSNIKARNIGDVVTVAINESATADNAADTSTARDSSASVSLSKLFGFEQDLDGIHKNIDPDLLLDAAYRNSFKGSGGTSREGRLQAVMAARIMEVYPDGNLLIKGSKQITINNETNLLRLAGIIRPEDISAQNVVDSKHVMNSNINYQGRGVISDKQSQGWLVRILDNIWPF